MIGNHSEFTTEESFHRVREYLGQGGSVMIHGGDSFAVRIEILPSLDEPRYLWQRGHVWTHLSDQASDFLGPVLLPPDAAASTPILNPTAGKTDGTGPGAGRRPTPSPRARSASSASMARCRMASHSG